MKVNHLIWLISCLFVNVNGGYSVIGNNLTTKFDLPDTTNVIDNKPEILITGNYIENADNGIGTYFYNNLYLPNITKKLKTIIHNIEFEYKSFNVVKIKIHFQNIYFDKNTFNIYEEIEEWKQEPYLNKKQKELLPFLSLFLPEPSNFSYDKIEFKSKIFSIDLKDKIGNSIEIAREVNQIIFHPDSYFKLLIHPNKNDKKYKVFAGHNVVFFSPPDNNEYILEFYLLNYHPLFEQDEVVSEIPLVFCSNEVEIKQTKVSWGNDFTNTVFIHDPLEVDKPVNWDNPELPTSIPRIKLSNYDNA
jgi:hypothetical protein